MSESSGQAEIDSRDDEALVFAKVGQAKLSSYEDQARGNDVPLAVAAEYGTVCLRDAEGIGGTRLQSHTLSSTCRSNSANAMRRIITAFRRRIHSSTQRRLLPI